MKKRWQQIRERIDALNLRERALLFAVAAVVLVTLVNAAVIDPLFTRQQELSQQMKLDQQQVAAMQATMQSFASHRGADPDAASRQRLRDLQLESSRLRTELQGLQKGIVSPDKMASLLQDILTRDGKLRLVSLKKLPAVVLKTADGVPAHGGKERDAGAGNAVYQHEVEVVVQGRYLDLMNYLVGLENLPWQLFWSSATLKVDAYPESTLTLRMFTLGLDRTWLNL